MPKSKLLRILFPEIQVIDHIKEVGIIDKDHFKKNKRTLEKTNINMKNKISNKAKSSTSKLVIFDVLDLALLLILIQLKVYQVNPLSL